MSLDEVYLDSCMELGWKLGKWRMKVLCWQRNMHFKTSILIGWVMYQENSSWEECTSWKPVQVQQDAGLRVQPRASPWFCFPWRCEWSFKISVWQMFVTSEGEMLFSSQTTHVIYLWNKLRSFQGGDIIRIWFSCSFTQNVTVYLEVAFSYKNFAYHMLNNLIFGRAIYQFSSVWKCLYQLLTWTRKKELNYFRLFRLNLI